MTKTVRARCSLELERQAVRWVTGGQGKLKGADSKVVNAWQMEISRLRAGLARVKMEGDNLGKAAT